MTGFKTVFSGVCAVTLLAACQKPMVFTPETIQPFPLQQNTAPVAAPVAVQPVVIQSAPVAAEPAYILESAPVVQAAPEPVYVIESDVAGDAMVQPVSETMIVSEPVFSAIPEPVVETELEILSAPVLESSVAPTFEQTIVETFEAPVVDTMSAPVVDTMSVPATEIEIVQESFSTFTEGGASGVAIIEPSIGVNDVMSVPAAPQMIDAQPLAPLGAATYGQPL